MRRVFLGFVFFEFSVDCGEVFCIYFCVDLYLVLISSVVFFKRIDLFLKIISFFYLVDSIV